MPLVAHTRAVRDVGPSEREAMWAVFHEAYEDVSRSTFDRDLDAKDHVIVLTEEGVIRGFSTVRRDHRTLGDGRRVVVVFSGDTVISPGSWGQTALQRAFFRYVAATKLRWPHRLVVWFLISKGYKTYLLLTRNFPDFYPRRDAETPGWARDLIGVLAKDRFGEAWDPETGLLRFAQPQGRLRPGVAPPDDHDDLDIRFFVERNPGHANGDELCCLGLVNARLMVSFPLKHFGRLRRSGPASGRPRP